MIGKITGITRDWKSKRYQVTVEVEELPPDIETLAGHDQLDITMKKHREKRSLDANAYFHVLCSRIAEKLHESLTERKNKLIAEYGQIDLEIKSIILDDQIDWAKVEPLHLRPTTATKVLDNGRLYRVYIVMRGSHTYDTKEMSRLIDGTVEQAKELGIETLTPEQIGRMVAAWSARYAAKEPQTSTT